MSDTTNISLPIISFKDIVDFIRRNFYLFLIVATFCGVLGFLFSYSVSNTFTAKTILLPEYKIEGGRSSFFSMAIGGNSGFDGAEKLAPDLYPSVLSSVPFGQFLLKQPVTDQEGIQYKAYEDYLKKDSSSVSLIARLKSMFRPKKKQGEGGPKSIVLADKDVLYLTSAETGLISRSMVPIVCEIETKSGGTITIQAEMEDPVIGAQLVEYSKKYLINYVEDYRSTKITEQSKFLAGRVDEAQNNLRNAEYALQNYKDRNRDAYLNVARIQEQRLQSDYTLALSIYNDLVFKLEQAKIKEKEDKPVFKVLEPTRVPLVRSGPDRKMYGLIAAVLGFVVVLGYVVLLREKLHLKLLTALNA